MGLRSQVMVTTGPSGCGKTLRRGPYFLTREFLPNTEGIHISNFPLKLEPWRDANGVDHSGLVEYMAGKGMAEDTVRQRVVVLDAEVVESWRNVGWKPMTKPAGPWDTFAGVDLAGVHLAIDEIHNFCGANTSPQIRRRWQEWLGELRHSGATIEFLSQSPAKVAKEIFDEAEIRLELVPQDQRPDPWFGIKMYYWYNLRAKLGFGYRPSVWQIELRQVGTAKREKWEKQGESPFWFEPEFFGLYDSYSRPVSGGSAGSSGRKEFEQLGWLRFVGWFVWDNGLNLAWRGGLVVLLVLLMVFRQEAANMYWGMFARVGKGRGGAAVEKGQAAELRAAAELPAVSPAAAFSAGSAGLDPRVEQLLDEKDQLEGELRALSVRYKSLVDKVEQAFAVASITRDGVTFRSGYTYRVGERIDFGPYEGRTIQGVDYERRIVILSDGRRLRMGVGGSATAARDWMQGREAAGATNPPKSSPDLSGSLQPVGSGSSAFGSRVQGGGPGDGFNVRDADGGVRSMALESDGKLHRR